MRRTISIVLFLLLSASASGTEVYRCSGADGVRFQDRPCRAEETQQLLHLADDPVVAPAAAADGPADADAKAPPAAAVVTAAPTAAPDFFLCTRYDGSRYVSDDGRGGGSAVPYAMVGSSGQSLAQAYGGPNGIGVSAPGLRTPPTIPTSKAPLAGNYVWIEDQCHHAQAAEACMYLRGELGRVDDKLKRAFSDTEAQLREEQARLRARMQGC